MAKYLSILWILASSMGAAKEFMAVQEKTQRPFFIKTDPLRILLGTIKIGVGKAVTGRFGLELDGSFTRFSEQSIWVSGYQAELSSYYGFKDWDRDSFYLKFGLGVGKKKHKIAKDKEERVLDYHSRYFMHNNAKLLFGYRFIWESGFHIKVASGVEYFLRRGDLLVIRDGQGKEIDLIEQYRTFAPAGELAIGYIL